MLIDIRIRRCLNVQYTNIKIAEVGKVFSENMDIVFCIFKGNEYYANLDWTGLYMLSSQEKLMENIDTRSDREWVNGLRMDEIEKFFCKYQDATVLLEKPEKWFKEIWTANREEVCAPVNRIDFSIYMKLRQKGIKAYIINVPAEVKNVYGPFCKLMLTERWIKGSKDIIRSEIESNLKRITDLSCEEYFAEVLDKFPNRRQNKQLGDENIERTIFLIGPCIVTGYSPSESYIAEILNSLLEKYNILYKIIKINSAYFLNEIMEYNICQNDIVIFLGTGLSYKDYDLTEDYEQYDGIKNLCTSSTLHTSKAGCKLIAEAIMREIIIPNNDTVNIINDNQVLSVAEKGQLQVDTEYEIKMYLKRLKIPKYMRFGNNGAIVMNANPYTIGHRQLVEYASSNVDRLFIFVVEEDASFFSFKERFEMVLQGTKDIKNAIVVGSGNFIISNKTFYDYFTKEIDKGKKIDASKDVLIFAKYIAPYLNIKRRFVGTEPTDRITEQYNEQMKKLLPNYGCELIEIPRFRVGNELISGKTVRKAILENNIDYLYNLLPVTSYEFIKNNLEILQEREVGTRSNQNAFLTDRLLWILEIVDFINKEQNIIIYGVGNDTIQLLKLLNKEVIEKIIYVDGKAETSEITFSGKKVLPPYKLMEMYRNHYIIILSSKHYKEIYYKCLDLGFEKSHIKYNPYDLYNNCKLDI